MHLLLRIENYLKQNQMAPTRFGRNVVRDPRFVFDLRNGRELRPRTALRVAAYLDRFEQIR